MLGSHFKRLLTMREIPFLATSSRQVDITDLNQVSEFIRANMITHVINCAAYTQVDKAETDQKQAYLINAHGPHHLGIACKRHRTHLIHFSTDYVFDGNGRFPYLEEVPCAPIGVYGMSKWAGEVKLLEEYTRVCIIRTSWLFGHPGKNFVETMLRLMEEKEELKIVADQTGCPTYCEDLAEAGLKLLEDEGIYHFSNASETTWYEFAHEIRKQAKELGFPVKCRSILPIHTHEYPTAAKRPAFSTLNTNKIRSRLGSEPRPWQQALHDYLSLIKKI